MHLKRSLSVAIALTLVASAASADRAETARVLDRRNVAVSPVGAATHALALQVYTFRGTRWHSDEIAKAIPRVSELLAQCGVNVQRFELVVLDAPPPYRYYDTPLSRELVRSLDLTKPALFFVEDTRNDPAFDAEAVGLGNSVKRPELANTVWVAYGARDLPNAIAHELVHVLSDSGQHSRTPGNLMRDETSPENTALTREQCERAVVHGEANKLLSPVRRQ